MKALVWLVALLFQTLLAETNLLAPIETQSVKIHTFFVGLVGPGPFSWFYSAILFGEEKGLSGEPYLQSFYVLGLYHLIVVSGGHLTAIHNLLKAALGPLQKSKRLICEVIIGLFLLIFTLANSLQPACFRAYVGWILNVTFKSKFCSNSDIQIIATIICLLIKPQLTSSLSFQLSCAASMALTFVESLQIKNKMQKRGLQAAACTLLTCPLILQVNPCLSWLIIPANFFLLPILEATLIPLALWGFTLPFLSAPSEFTLKITFEILSALQNFSEPFMCLDLSRRTSWGMLYVGTVTLSWRLLLSRYHRKEFQKSQSHQCR